MSKQHPWNQSAGTDILLSDQRWLLFFMIWTLVLLVVLKDTGVDASSMPIQHHQLPEFSVLQEPPAVAQGAELAEGLMQNLQSQSEVFSGRWQPNETRSQPLAEATRVTEKADHANQPLLASGETGVTPPPMHSVKQPATESPTEKLRADSRTLRKLNARRLIQLEDYAEAYLTLMQDLPEVTQDTEYYELLGPVLIQTRRFQQAADVYASLLSMRQDNPRWWAGYAVSLEKLGVPAGENFAFQELHKLAASDSVLQHFAWRKLTGLG